jgi:hypothetical protein
LLRPGTLREDAFDEDRHAIFIDLTLELVTFGHRHLILHERRHEPLVHALGDGFWRRRPQLFQPLRRQARIDQRQQLPSRCAPCPTGSSASSSRAFRRGSRRSPAVIVDHLLDRVVELGRVVAADALGAIGLGQLDEIGQALGVAVRQRLPCSSSCHWRTMPIRTRC